LQIEQMPIERLVPYVRNARTHSADQIAQIAASIAEFGFVNPILIGEDDVIVAGHGRLMAAQQLGLPEVPVVVLDHLSDAQRRALVIADNRLAQSAGWDQELLRAELAALREDEFDLDILGFDLSEIDEILAGFEGTGAGSDAPGPGADGDTPLNPSAPGALAQRFGVPPFSVLDARKGWWQDRKRAWIDLGIRSELGRGAAPGGSPAPLDRAKAEPGGSKMPAANYSRSKARGDGRGRAVGR
tara:strand:+ start:5693 stop:6421 length:729 start_codon:yes stop_codon:yes gene_type:complete